jgi:hypothetical protein
MQESIPCLVIEQPDPPGEAGKVVLIDRAGGLIGAGNRDMAFFSSSRSAALFSVWLAIRPSRNTGFLAPAIIFATRSMASSGAAPVCGASLAGRTLAWTGPSTTSCGRLTKALPGRPCSAARNALETTSASASGR